MSVSANYVGRNHDLDLFIPSYDVFFLGCVLKCVFCHNSDTSQVMEPRKSMSEKRLAKIIDIRSTSKIVDFVGGDPLPQLPFVLKTLKHIKRDIPIMWNSSFYMTEKSMDLLSGIIDVYSPDFKYGNDDCAKRLSDVKNYTKIVSRNISIAAEDSELIIRHLIMPNHIEYCSKPVLDCISEKHGDKLLVHIMDQYTPVWRAKQYSDIKRTLRKKEFREVIQYAEEKGLNFVSDF